MYKQYTYTLYMHAYHIHTDTHTYLYKHTFTWLLGSLKKQLMLLSCVAGEDSRESLGQQGDQTTQS